MRATQSRAMLRDMLGADIDASKQVSVPRQFESDFELVATRYNLRELGEYEEAKEAARRDIENAISTYAQLAKEEA